jgi:hypothetical protein
VTHLSWLPTVVKPPWHPLAVLMGAAVDLLGHADHEFVAGNGLSQSLDRHAFSLEPAACQAEPSESIFRICHNVSMRCACNISR